ncbi:MAG TPA: c-type cytochrome [Candidatus Binataceae bacterium]|nr:c-type cytochrome [Candidatus Binataceae bacterium]
MKTNFFRSGFFLLAIAPAVALLPRAAFAQQKLGAPPGKGSFVRYCASCHGVDGKGDGPMASMLSTKPSDLTQLAKKNNGTFPALKVADIIDGRNNVSAHGTPDMPVWGERFAETESGSGSHTQQTAIRERIQLIIRYINHIQEK